LTHRAKKRFGQNFLHDPGIIGKLLRGIAARPGDTLVEIGPGLGALTCPLLEQTGRLDVVELDRDLIPLLREKCAGRGELTIHQADALKFDFRSLVPPGARIRVVGNLPYNISTPLIFHLLSSKDVIADMHFMLQKEVVDRLAAEPGGGDYGRLSVMTQYHCRVERLFNVPPGAFSPPPKVQSAVVRLIPHAPMPAAADDETLLAEVVTRAFAQRRKTLRNTLKGLAPAQLLQRLGIDPGRRAETLTVEQFVAIANALH
jgi:16S rRNA (adenine1518-N6/adenine1519-N6)-dimethyltransferase